MKKLLIYGLIALGICLLLSILYIFFGFICIGSTIGFIFYTLFEIMYFLIPFALIGSLVVIVLACMKKCPKLCLILSAISLYATSTLCIENCFYWSKLILLNSYGCQFSLVFILVLSLLLVAIDKSKNYKMYILLSLAMLIFMIAYLGHVVLH